jgi:hypothetical protein
MPRGRPVKSQIRQNVIELLFYLKQGYGYNIAKVYNDIFPQVHQRSIYYHLRKGVATGEFIVHEIKEEKGEFSWGQKVEKTYYALGKEALIKGNKDVAKHFSQKKSFINRVFSKN